jgi:hypothetical protein
VLIGELPNQLAPLHQGNWRNVIDRIERSDFVGPTVNAVRERVFRRLRLLRGSAAGLSGKRLSAVAILTDDGVMKQELGPGPNDDLSSVERTARGQYR